VKTAVIPFEMAVELVPEVVRGADAGLRRLEEGLRPTAPEFGDIVHRSEVMKDLIERAHQCAAYGEPVLIQGESGTGKEMLARALHRASKTTSGLNTISTNNVRAVQAQTPPLELQLRYSELVDRVRVGRQAAADAHDATQGLFESLVHRAFQSERPIPAHTGARQSGTVARDANP
jgi:hypothetical protein